MAIIIDKSQYKNFSCKIGRKNKVTKVIGKKYIIDTATQTSYDEGTREGAPGTFASETMQARSSKGSFIWTIIVWWGNGDYWLRQEVGRRKMVYYFTVTGRTITNINNMTAKYTLYYNTYEQANSSLINANNYSAASSTKIFSQIATNANRPDSSRHQDGTYEEYDAETNTSIPYGLACARYDSETGNYIEYIYPSYGENTCKVEYVSKTRSQDGVNYDYRFKVTLDYISSVGYNQFVCQSFGTDSKSQKAFYNDVVKVRVEVSGYTVSKEEVDAAYSQSEDESKVLELQTNELIQENVDSTPVTIGNRVLSFDYLANEIVTAYKDNRLIATFDLINNKKYMIGGEERLLRAGDRIKIKDLDEKYLSSSSEVDTTVAGNDFEILKANTRYNGFFYREITAREVLSTSTPPPTEYAVSYATMGQGSSSSINFVCDAPAAEGETVSFTAAVLDNSLEITGILLYKQSGEQIGGLTSKNGVYSFTMPASPVTVTFLLNAKTYSLSFTCGTGTTLTITRTSSPIRGAGTGVLSNGAKIYHGDVLTVQVTATSGYKNATYTGFTSGASVSGNVNIVSSATPYAWNTVFTGSAEGVTSHGTFATVTNGLVNYTAPTRITGYAMWYQNYQTMGQYPAPQFSAIQLTGSPAEIASAMYSDSSGLKSTKVGAYLDSSEGIKICAYGMQQRTGTQYITAKFFITKIEQWY